MLIEVYLKETSQKIIHKNIENTYTKGPLYCVYSKVENKVYKYPLDNIFKIQEDYNEENTVL